MQNGPPEAVSQTRATSSIRRRAGTGGRRCVRCRWGAGAYPAFCLGGDQLAGDYQTFFVGKADGFPRGRFVGRLEAGDAAMALTTKSTSGWVRLELCGCAWTTSISEMPAARSLARSAAACCSLASERMRGFQRTALLEGESYCCRRLRWRLKRSDNSRPRLTCCDRSSGRTEDGDAFHAAS